MASTWPTEVALLRDLVATPSISGDEEAVACYVEIAAREWGLDVRRDETGVTISVGSSDEPTLAFVSHLDVVPPGEGWSRDPFTPVIDRGQLYGRGSGDAKASVAAMLTAARDVAGTGGPTRGRLLCLFGYGEETRHTSMGAAVASAGRIDAAVVGEPTNLNLAIAQRGLMMVDLTASGDQRHAGYASDGTFTNAIQELSHDLLLLDQIADERVHPILGRVTVTPTMVEGGISRNVTPPSARAVLDIRSTPAWTHAELGALLTEKLRCRVTVTSDRLVPCETPGDSRLRAVAQSLRPEAQPFGSPTCSDWVFVRTLDALKCGPGTSRRSHTADECVDLDEVTAARAFYGALAQEYLS